jgi:protein phosphatase
VRCDSLIEFEGGAATSAGHRRAANEDSHVVGRRFAIVADGMGGHAAGGTASAIAVDVIGTRLDAARAIRVATIHEAIDAADLAIRTRAMVDDTDGMGTTVVAAVVVEGADGAPAVAVAHAGDSRCYRYKAGVLGLVTVDHSLVQQLVSAGRISSDQAASHPMANVVTRALGVDGLAFADVVLLPVEPCRLLLCSDGLSDELPAQTIGRVLAGIVDPQAAADRLLELALSGVARDNITAVVLDVAPAHPT